MDYQTTLLLTGAAIIVLLILVMAGLVLSARSYTQLLGLIASLGSLLAQQHQATRQAVMYLSDALENDTPSVHQGNTPTTPGKAP